MPAPPPPAIDADPETEAVFDEASLSLGPALKCGEPLNPSRQALAATWVAYAGRMARRRAWQTGRFDRIADYRSDALLAVVLAAGDFDSARGVRFKTWLWWKHWGVVRDSLKDERASRPPGEAGRLHPGLADQKAPQPALEAARRDEQEWVGRALDKLPERWREIVCLRAGVGGLDEEARLDVANRMGVSDTRVNQIRRQAYRALRVELARGA